MNIPKDALVQDARLYDPKKEKLAKTALSTKAYEAAFAQAEAEVENLIEVERALPDINARLASLEAKGNIVRVDAELKAPAKAKRPQAKVGPLDMTTNLIAVEFLRHSTDLRPREAIARLLPGDDFADARKQLKDLVAKSETSTGTTTQAGWAAELVQSETLAFWEPMENRSVVAALASRARVQEFGPNNSVTVPMRNKGKTMHAGWVAENATIPVKAGAFASTTMYRHKVGVISTFTNELARTSIVNMQTVIRSAIIEDTTDFIDEWFLDRTQGGSVAASPASPFFGVTGRFSQGTGLDNILQDLKFLAEEMIKMKARAPIILINPLRLLSLSTVRDGAGNFVFREDLAAGELMGLPFLSSNNVPEDEIFAIDTDALLLANDQPLVDVSASATLVMVDDQTPDPSIKDPDEVNLAGSIKVSDAASTVGGPAEVHSIWQQDATAIRFVLPMSWGMIQQNCTFVGSVTW